MVVSYFRRLRFPILYAALAFAGILEYSKCPLDEVVGTIEPVDGTRLTNRVKDKSALVVGGTRGIGRGVAITLAKAGANVEVVGRSEEGGSKVVRFMRSTALRPSHQSLGSYVADLSTVNGCLNLTKRLQDDKKKFDYIIFTVGQWPDRDNPNNADGLDKVVGLDLVARFVILTELQPILKENARVLSVLASTARLSVMGFPSEQTIKDIISGNRPSYWLHQMMPSIGLAGDALLEQAAEHFPDVKFIGTHPGIVGTNLLVMSNTFPTSIGMFLQATIGWLSRTPIPMFLTEEQAGETQVQILSSPNVEKKGATYFNWMLEGRHINDLSYDEDFGRWVWSFAETFMKTHRS